MKITKLETRSAYNTDLNSNASRSNRPLQPLRQAVQRITSALHLAQLSTFGKRTNSTPAPQSPAHQLPQSPPNSPASDIINHPYAGFSTPVRAYLTSLDITPTQEARDERASSQRVPLAEEYDSEFDDDDHFHCLHKDDPLIDNNPHWHSGAVWSNEIKTPPPCEGVEEVKVNMP